MAWKFVIKGKHICSIRIIKKQERKQVNEHMNILETSFESCIIYSTKTCKIKSI